MKKNNENTPTEVAAETGHVTADGFVRSSIFKLIKRNACEPCGVGVSTCIVVYKYTYMSVYLCKKSFF